MKYHGKLYGKGHGKTYFPLVLTSEDVDEMERQAAACREIIDHLHEWLNGATLETMKLKGMVEAVRSSSRTTNRL